MAAEHNELTLYEPQQSSLVVRPLVTPAEARQAIQEYEALKTAIVQPGDVQKIQGRDFLKKSFWRRVATCFGVSLELVGEERGFDEGKHLYYSVLYRAVAPNGRTMIGDGYCSTAESGRGSWPEHNVRATAHTRAKNRAISDLVGGGEVSAEEIPDYVDATPPQPPRPTRPAPARPTPAPAPIPAADDTRPVITPQISRDRARLQAAPITDETPITYTMEEPSPTAIADLAKVSLARQISDLKRELNISPERYKNLISKCRSNDEVLAKLQELKDAKDDGFPLDRPAQKAAQG